MGINYAKMVPDLTPKHMWTKDILTRYAESVQDQGTRERLSAEIGQIQFTKQGDVEIAGGQEGREAFDRAGVPGLYQDLNDRLLLFITDAKLSAMREATSTAVSEVQS